VSDFSDAGTLVPAAIAVGTFMMALALIITGGRLYAHRRQLAWSDCKFPQGNSFLYVMARQLIRLPDFCTAALVFAITETSLMFFRELPGVSAPSSWLLTVRCGQNFVLRATSGISRCAGSSVILSK
jgi:hypothetical protein